jgi:pimeloyl-ACP methyl ester carboxylesterase
MPMLKRDDGEIYYEVRGEGFPVLMLAAGAMRSSIGFWPPKLDRIFPWANWPDALEGDYQVVLMDQRNAGKSRTAIEPDHGWHTFAADHFALMDHLGHDRFHVVGVCIGGSFALRLCEDAPDRVAAQIVPQPIGFDPGTPDHFPTNFANWSEEILPLRPDLDPAKVRAFGANLMHGDFVYSVTRDAARNCRAPTLVMPGGDVAHPRAIAEELRELMPNAEWLENWECPQHERRQLETGLAFLAKYTP